MNASTTIAQLNNDCSVIVVLAHPHVLGIGLLTQKERRKLMGLMSLLGMLDATDDIEAVVRWHLSANCYPPLPEAYVPMCVEAIRACQMQTDENEKIMLQLPDGMFYKGDQTLVDAWTVIEAFHLEGFMMEDEYED